MDVGRKIAKMKGEIQEAKGKRLNLERMKHDELEKEAIGVFLVWRSSSRRQMRNKTKE